MQDHAAQLLPDAAEAAVFGLSSVADVQLRAGEGRAVLSCLAALEPIRWAKSTAAKQSKEGEAEGSQARAIAKEILAALPEVSAGSMLHDLLTIA